jgi:hypothetical protein
MKLLTFDISNVWLAALSTAITCASLALADAGIEMYDLVSACTAVCNLIPLSPPSSSLSFISLLLTLLYLPPLFSSISNYRSQLHNRPQYPQETSQPHT